MLRWVVNDTYICQEMIVLFVQNLAEMVYIVWRHLKVRQYVNPFIDLLIQETKETNLMSFFPIH